MQTMDFGRVQCVNVGPSVVTNVPFIDRKLYMYENRACMRNLYIFSSFLQGIKNCS